MCGEPFCFDEKGSFTMNRGYGLAARLLAAILCLALILCGFAGCSQVSEIVSGVTGGGEYPVEINGVTISSKPQKVVVLSPSLADVVLALGCETQLAAGTQECTQDSLRDLAKIDGGDPQAVLEAAPDLVLSDSFDDGMSSALSEAGVAMLAVEPATDREDFERLYSQVSSALLGGGSGYDKGIQTAQDIFTTLDDINRIVPKDKVTTACYLYDLDGSAVTGDMFGSTVMSYAGVTNVFKSLNGGVYEFESLRVSNPDAIFCVPGLKNSILTDSRFSNFQAVLNGKVFEMEPSWIEWQGRTVVTTALEISGDCFPELLEENSMQVTDPTEGIESAVNSALESSALEADTTVYETLREGDQGEDVLKMQERLEELGYLETEYDGYYGSHTAGCVRDFQEANGLDGTGVADADTQRKLYSNSAKAKEEAQSSSQAE